MAKKIKRHKNFATEHIFLVFWIDQIYNSYVTIGMTYRAQLNAKKVCNFYISVLLLGMNQNVCGEYSSHS